jgi:hypothetical protein
MNFTPSSLKDKGILNKPSANKILRKHEEYIVDKSLIKRITTAKSCINNNNNYFE